MAGTVLKPVIVIVTLGLFVQLGLTYLEIDIQKYEQIGETKYVDFTGIKVRRENRTRKLFGNVTFHIDLGSDAFTQGQMFHKTGSGYQRMPFKLARKPFCDSVNEGKYFYPEIAELSTFPPQPVQCPFPKGVYTFNGFHYVGKNLPIMIMPSGDYAAEISFWKLDLEVFRFRGYISVVNI